MIRRWVPICVLLAACADPDQSEEVPPEVVVEDPCEGAVVLGQDGILDHFDATWSYDNAQGLSLTEPIHVIVPEGVEGLTITVNAGDVKTGVASLSVEGVSMLDWTGKLAYGDRTTALDADDTAFDSADTGGELQDTGEPGHGWGSDPFYHWPDVGGTIVMPMNEATKPRPGCMTFMPAALANLSGHKSEIVVATKMTPLTSRHLDLNLFLAEGIELSDEDLDVAIGHMQHVFDSAEGPIVHVTRKLSFSLEDGPFVSDMGSDINKMRATLPEIEMDKEALNLFFIEDFIGGGLLGIAGGIPGPFIQGTGASGVVMSVEAHLNADGEMRASVLGETMAHELAHQFGLFHTTESDGAYHDVIADTPECDPERDENGDGDLDADECFNAGGTNFMFWKSADFPQDSMTPEQAMVLNSSPLAH